MSRATSPLSFDVRDHLVDDPATPDLEGLTWPRQDPSPLADTSTSEIVAVLGELGRWIEADPDGVMNSALREFLDEVPAPAHGLHARAYAELPRYFSREILEFQLDQELGGGRVLDEWTPVRVPGAEQPSFVRAFPCRMVHVLAGNAPGIAAITIARSALVKGASLLKMASNDLHTTPALLRGLAAVAPGHPIVESFASVYWRGGDPRYESVLFRSIFFDKIVVWGGGEAVRNAARYAGPGIDVVSFDPKSSISVIGSEAFAQGAAGLKAVADAAATDATVHDQDACTASRFQFVQGTVEQVDAYCAELVAQLGLERAKASPRSGAVPADQRDEIDALRMMAPEYRVWGATDGTGMVIRSDEPVDFFPSGRVVNVVRVADPTDVLAHVDASTQTVGLFPDELRLRMRDALCRVGVQRVTPLGRAGDTRVGLPHDGFYPLSRMIRWGKDEA